jgi:PBP1b-binding outer membrane lipoprotein LpoB
MNKIKRIGAILSVCLLITGCVMPQIAKNPGTSPPETTEVTTNYVVDPAFITTIETIREVNRATAPVNPFSTTLELLLMAALAATGVYAKIKTKRLNRSDQLLTTVIQGVELASSEERPAKQVIQSQAITKGLESELYQKVQDTVR